MWTQYIFQDEMTIIFHYRVITNAWRRIQWGIQSMITIWYINLLTIFESKNTFCCCCFCQFLGNTQHCQEYILVLCSTIITGCVCQLWDACQGYAHTGEMCYVLALQLLFIILILPLGYYMITMLKVHLQFRIQQGIKMLGFWPNLWYSALMSGSMLRN